jgi:ABC-type branched-subunit amino acid transport system ATPase component/branched-subunit amino acid ABC-type transport system permease component
VLPFIIAGLTSGSVYALAGVGLVLTYKTSKLFNFAHGALATVSAYLFYTLHVQHKMPWGLAAVICVFVVGPLLGLLFERIARVVSTASVAIRVVSTIGVLLIVQASVVLIYGVTLTRRVPQFLPELPFHIAGTTVTMDRIIVFAVGVLATAGLYIYLRVTRIGVAMRAVVDDPALLDTAGTSPVKVRRWSWMIGVTFAAASGLLVTPYLFLDATALTFLVVAAYGAAALGGFTSLPGTYVGGLAVGVAAALASKYFTTGVLSGLSSAVPFLALFLVLLVSPRRRFAERANFVARSESSWTAPWQFQSVLGIALLGVLIFVPNFSGVHLADYSRFLAITILFLSLGLLVRTSGQVSLSHVSFMAIGVCGFSHLTVDHHWPWGLALLAGGLIAVPIGALLAVPAVRLSGLFLALATFGFGILLQYMFYSSKYMFGVLGNVIVPAPQLSAIGLNGTDKCYYYLCLVLAGVAVAIVLGITRGRLGRLLRALGDSPVGLATTGTSVNVTRVVVFCTSAFMAGVAGILEAGAVGSASGGSYLPLTSLVYFALIVIVSGRVPWYALVAAAGIVIIPSYVTSANTSYWLQLVFGLSAVGFAMTPENLKGAPPALRSALDRLVRHGAKASAVPEIVNVDLGSLALTRDVPGVLRAEGIRVSFGGLAAVDGVTVEVQTGRITGLIGPNGAGKTTLFNACSGLNRPNNGTIALDGSDVSHRSPSARARKGLGRTFQQMELFDSLTVRENVELGLEGSYAGPNVLRHFASLPGTKRKVRAATQHVLAQCDLLALADRPAGALSTGQRRLVELARCLAGPAHILLLDEPSSGLDRAETNRFGQILKEVVAERGVGIFLVEHDMELVTDICDYIYVLDFGKPIFEGTPREVLDSPVVQAAYLGDDESVLAVAGAIESGEGS